MRKISSEHKVEQMAKGHAKDFPHYTARHAGEGGARSNETPETSLPGLYGGTD
jgi:hypothetical protein